MTLTATDLRPYRRPIEEAMREHHCDAITAALYCVRKAKRKYEDEFIVRLAAALQSILSPVVVVEELKKEKSKRRKK